MALGVGPAKPEDFRATSIPGEGTVVYDVEKIINDGKIEETLTPLPGYKVTMHTLTVGESERVKRESGGRDLLLNPDPNTTDIDMTYWLSVLTYGITDLNGKSYRTPEEKRALRNILENCQHKVVFALVAAWASLLQKQRDVFGDAETKKDS